MAELQVGNGTRAAERVRTTQVAFVLTRFLLRLIVSRLLFIFIIFPHAVGLISSFFVFSGGTAVTLAVSCARVTLRN